MDDRRKRQDKLLAELVGVTVTMAVFILLACCS
mgnify:CR=1 FL=1